MKRDEIYIHHMDMLFKYIRLISNSDYDIEDIQFKSQFFVDNLINDYMSLPSSEETLKDSIHKMKKTITIILNSIEKGFEISIDLLDKNTNILKKLEKFRKQYPTYVRTNHPKEFLDFYKKLKKDEYDFSETGSILGLSRQTISKYVKNNEIGSTNNKKVSKENIYVFFVKKNWIK